MTNKKLTILQAIGYFHHSNANWSYNIYQLYMQGECKEYFKVAFQDERQVIARLYEVLKDTEFSEINILPTIYAGNQTQQIKGISKIPDISKFIKHLKNKYNK